MKVLGIIAEYNPFHNGHRYHLEQALAQSGADCSAVVMSGNFLQRGEPAMWDKRVRAAAAVENGVDLVLELPFVFACNNAEQFAYGGISLLNGLGCVTDLAFGCEGDPEKLLAAAGCLAREDEEFKGFLAGYLKRGMAYPAARTAALAACGQEEEARLLTEPNNILAAEYLKQCILSKSTMKLHGIRRADEGYNSTSLPAAADADAAASVHPIAGAGVRPMASAGAIRKEILQRGSLDSVKSCLPAETLTLLNQVPSTEWMTGEDFFLPAAAVIRRASAEELSRIWAVTEGLEHLLKKEVIRAGDMESLLVGIKSKRYTRTRLQRVVIQALMGLLREDYEEILSEKIRYGHVLAFSKKGAALLKHIRKTGCGNMPIYSNLSKGSLWDTREQVMLKYDLLAADLYHLAQKKDIYSYSDLVLRPYFKKY